MLRHHPYVWKVVSKPKLIDPWLKAQAVRLVPEHWFGRNGILGAEHEAPLAKAIVVLVFDRDIALADM